MSLSTPKNRVLAALPDEERERFFSCLHPVSLALKQVLVEAGAPLDAVYFMQQGVTSILTDMADGSVIEVGMIGFEGVVGLPTVLGHHVSTQQIVVQVPGTALRMSAAEFKLAFDQSDAIRAVVLRCLGTFLDLSAQTAACNRFHSIEQRCVRRLLMVRDRLESDVLPMTHEILASMLGVRRAGVTEVAGDLQRAGLIRYHRGLVTIIDREGLEEAACECYAVDYDRFMRLVRVA